MKQHKHAELIKLWATGATIQYLHTDGKWYNYYSTPDWHKDNRHRVKPEPEFPKTTLTGDDLYQLVHGKYDELGWREALSEIANYVIAEFIRSGEMDAYVKERENNV